MAYKDVTPPRGGKITIANGKLTVPENPILPFIRGDGTGPDIWAASVRVFDAAVQKAYGGKRKISCLKFCGRRKFQEIQQLAAGRHGGGVQGILGRHQRPADDTDGGGIRSLNVALRQMLDLYVCLRPVQWFTGCRRRRETSREGEHGHLRENTEDIYAGIDFEAGQGNGAQDD